MSVCALARGGFEQELVPRAVLKEASMQTRTGWPKQRRQAKTAVGIWRWVRWRKNVRGGRTLRVCQRTGEGETKRATDGTNRRQTDDGQTGKARSVERATGRARARAPGILQPAANWGRLWCWISGKFFTGKERRLRRGNRRTERERSGEPNRFLQRFFLTASGC